MCRIEIDKELCKACGYCIKNCPQGCIRPSQDRNKFAYHYSEQFAPEKCVGCKICAYSCPEACITVYKEVN